MTPNADFERVSTSALESLNRALDTVAEQHEVEILYQGGVLTIEVEEPVESKIVISPNSSAGQIWISAQSTSFKLDWNADSHSFLFEKTGEDLRALTGRLIGEELGIDRVDIPG